MGSGHAAKRVLDIFAGHVHFQTVSAAMRGNVADMVRAVIRSGIGIVPPGFNDARRAGAAGYFKVAVIYSDLIPSLRHFIGSIIASDNFIFSGIGIILVPNQTDSAKAAHIADRVDAFRGA